MSKIIHLSWNGATDDKGINAYELLYSLAPTFNNWQQAAIINTTQSNVSYDFEVKDYVDHRFSIRTIDTIGQYSDYKYVTQTVGPVPSFISSTSSATIGTCGNPTYTPANIINIYSNNSLIGNTDVLSGNIVKTEGNLTFNGYGRNWNVLHYNKSYNCIINSSGTVTSSISCSEPVTTPVTTTVKPPYPFLKGFDNWVWDTVLQPDGKIIVNGEFTKFNGETVPKGLVRLNPDASLDTTFNPAPRTNGSNYLDIQPDGKILVQEYPSKITRLNPDGSIDSSFVSPIFVGLYGLALQTDGSIIVYGSFSKVNGVNKPCIAKLTSTGALTTFNVTAMTGISPNITSLLMLSDNSMIISGTWVTINGISKPNLCKLTSTGTIDTSFIATIDSSGQFTRMDKLSDGRIVGVGQFTTLNGVTSTTNTQAVRLNANGTTDTSFTPAIIKSTNSSLTIVDVVVQPDNKVLIGGWWFDQVAGYSNKNGIARLNSNGTYDTTFNVSPGLTDTSGAISTGSTRSITLQPDGKIIVGGDFIRYNMQTRNYIVRINSDGTVES